jgi:hypothetical protein
MKVSLVNSVAGEVILVCADERLDLSAYNGFNEAIVLVAENPLLEAIVVDLVRTRQLFDSGKAMLLTLRGRAGHLKNRIYLANIAPELKHKLSQDRFPVLFNFIHRH